MNKRYLADALDICEQATPGPWEYYEDQYGDCAAFNWFNGMVCDFGENDPSEPTAGNKPKPEDARFIVEAREGWPYAIRRAQEAEQAVGFMRGAIALERERKELLRKEVKRLRTLIKEAIEDSKWGNIENAYSRMIERLEGGVDSDEQ